MAMQDEALSIIESFKLKEENQRLSNQLPFRCFVGKCNDLDINLVTSGIDPINRVDNIGCEAATLMANESISRLKPDIIISAGTAGGFSKLGAEIGTIYASKDYFVFHDRIVPLPGFSESGVGYFPAAKIDKMVEDLNLLSGVISTGSSLEKSNKDSTILEQHNVVAKEMEAAAIAWVAMLYKTPMFAIKSVTNLVDLDNQSEQEFVKNFDYAVKHLLIAVENMIHYLQRKTIANLAKA